MLFFKGGTKIIIIYVDRLEESRVIVVDDAENTITLPLTAFEAIPKEGDAFTLTLSAAPEKKKQIHEQISNLFERLKKGETKE